MNSTAAGQLFGYSLQFPRALLRLLEADVGAKVGIEVCGDVAVFFPEGGVLSEEDKSSLTGNALTNLSSNLWKTFYNWINAINAGEMNPECDRFVLYTNHPVTKDSLVLKFHDASNDSLENIINKVNKALAAVKKGHDLFDYKDLVLNKNLDLFKKIILRFELVSNHRADDVYQDIRRELERIGIEKKEIEWILNALTGWLQKTVMEMIGGHNNAIISKESFLRELRSLQGKIHRRELIDFAVSKMPGRDLLSKQANQRPVYVKQLEHIQLSDDEIIEAVSDYFRADSNRLDWIEQEIINEDDMHDFEGKLCSFHSTKQKTIKLTQSSLPEEFQGKLLLNECQTRQETIAGKAPPDRTIQGSYHVLADEKCLGWHPQWKKLLEHKTKGAQNGKTC
jgi:hypothetical protein